MPRAPIKKTLTLWGRKIKLTIRQWAWVGAAISGAGVLITGGLTFMAYAAPLYESDFPPFSNVDRVSELETKTAKTFGEVQQAQMQINNSLKDTREELTLSLLQGYRAELEKAIADVAANPRSVSARNYRDDLVEKINKLRARLN